MASEFDYTATDTPDEVIRSVAAEMSGGGGLKPLSDDELLEREIWREKRAEEQAWQSAQRRIDQERHESEERAAANHQRAIAAAQAREKARQESLARQEQQRRSNDLAALRSEAQQSAAWRNTVRLPTTANVAERTGSGNKSTATTARTGSDLRRSGGRVGPAWR